MKKKGILCALLLGAVFVLSGCAMRTVDDMYALPKRSQEFQSMQNAIDDAMKDLALAYCAPVGGENQQSVQQADLDGDGVDEYLVFTSGGTEMPLQVLIFNQEPGGICSLMEVIQSNGTAFEQVEYVNFDEKPGLELVIGRQVSDQVLRSVSVYSFSTGSAQLLLMNGYSRFITCDLDDNARSELMVLRPGEAGMDRGMAVLYSSEKGQIQRSVEMELSANTTHVRRMIRGKLQGGSPAIYVASVVGEKAVVTDVFSIQRGKFTNVSGAGETGAEVETLRNFFVYPEDIDGDGIMELPELITMKAVSQWSEDERKFLLRWYSLDAGGRKVEKLYSFHDYMGGWYIGLDSRWAERITVEQAEGQYTFYVWNESFEEATSLFTVYVCTGSSRDADVTQDGRFALYRGESASYGAKLERYADEYHVTEKYLIESFSPIYQDWQTGEIS